MSLLASLKRDWTAITYCKIKGHVINKKARDGLIKNADWTEVKCERCHSSVFIRVDPNDVGYYLLSECLATEDE